MCGYLGVMILCFDVSVGLVLVVMVGVYFIVFVVVLFGFIGLFGGVI